MIYAVNKRTKEHVLPGNFKQHDSEWRYVVADADGWIEWDRINKCPIPGNARCDIKTIAFNTYPGMYGNNEHVSWSSVVAYRPILEPQAEQVRDRLPDIGGRVEIKIGEDSWCPGKVIMHHEGQALVYLDSASQWRYKSGDANTIRPIRTDRERWIEAARNVNRNLRILASEQDMLEAIYDAGLARLPD